MNGVSGGAFVAPLTSPTADPRPFAHRMFIMTERDIVLALLDLEGPEARAAHLDRVCADNASLRAKVVALLKSVAEVGNFLDASAASQLGPRRASLV